MFLMYIKGKRKFEKTVGITMSFKLLISAFIIFSIIPELA